jgi:hypothetical protein
MNFHRSAIAQIFTFVIGAALIAPAPALALPTPGGAAEGTAKSLAQVKCGYAAPEYLPLAPGAGTVLSVTIAFYNAETQLFRSTQCSQAATGNLLQAVGKKEQAAGIETKLKNLSGKDPTPEQQAKMAEAANDEISQALNDAAENLTSVQDEQKAQIRSADLKRLAANLALATLVTDVGRLTIEIGTIAKKVKDKDPTILEEIAGLANSPYFLTVDPITVISEFWPEQIKGIGANAKAYQASQKEVSKVVKALQKKLNIEPPTKAEIQSESESTGG